MKRLLKKNLFSLLRNRGVFADLMRKTERLEDLAKVEALENEKIEGILDEFVELMRPSEVIVVSDTPEEVEMIRDLSKKLGEEQPLSKLNHTIHYDAYIDNANHDQARDVKNTMTLLPDSFVSRKGLNKKEREEGLEEIFDVMDGIMHRKPMLVRFFCLGPNQSDFSQLALQITDSAYVAHSEDLLYRPAYDDFLSLNSEEKDEFFTVIHSAGRLDSKGNTVDLGQRRIFVDPLEDRVFSANNQYAGNSLGLKKLCLRLAIYKSNIEKDWLAEHMFISGFGHSNQAGEDQGVAYFAGAYPSACGKTSTAMLEDALIVGDDIAYFRVGEEGNMKGVNIEIGCFGIIKGCNALDDPVIWDALMGDNNNEIIFSNVLKTPDGKVWWEGMFEGERLLTTPAAGYNHSNDWTLHKLDNVGNPIPLSHPNSRFTIKIEDLKGADMAGMEKKEGVDIEGILYGGRDSDTCVPVLELRDWECGIFAGAGVESETTAATLGKAGIKKPSPFANADFVVTPWANYIENHYRFGENLEKHPRVFYTNYFLCEHQTDPTLPKMPLSGKSYNKIWVNWAVGRVFGEDWAVETPLGFIPSYDSLEYLFAHHNEQSYSMDEYIGHFSIRSKMYNEKYNRVREYFDEDTPLPEEFTRLMDEQIKITEDLLKVGELISPLHWL